MGKLFGISGRSNRDGTRRSHWGKNEFNSSFPAALLCFMREQGVNPVYIILNSSSETCHRHIAVPDLFQIDPRANTIFFAFEQIYQPFQDMVEGSLERCDLVVMDTADSASTCRRGFEIKLTALPDSSTCHLDDSRFSCELVFRPPAVAQLALSIANHYRNRRADLLSKLSPVCSRIFNWRRPQDVMPHLQEMCDGLDNVFKDVLAKQSPFAIQPVWKTRGKSANLAADCLDVFVWSDLAFTRLFIDAARTARPTVMDRNQRTAIWLARMLYNFAEIGRFRPSLVTSEMAYELQTDKAFAIAGNRSIRYLASDELESPRMSKDCIKEIILENGHQLLSPERRFDAIIVNSPGLFD